MRLLHLLKIRLKKFSFLNKERIKHTWQQTQLHSYVLVFVPFLYSLPCFFYLVSCPLSLP